jgi:signal transduction histidine kinase
MPNIHRTLKVLIVEDVQSDYRSLISELERVNGKVHIQQVKNLIDLKNQLINHSWDLIVSDYNLNSFTALEALKITQSENPDIPFVLMSKGLGEETVADMIKAGVEDVVLWNRLERLHPIVKRIIKAQDSKAHEAKVVKIANEALAAKEQMLAIVSHDIKNPISAIQLEAQMLLKASEENLNISTFKEEVKIQAERILKTTDHMKVLISDLLDKNKSENCLTQLTKHPTSVKRLTQDVVENLKPLFIEKGIKIQTKIPESTFIFMDKNKIFQVLSNLLSNAIKFSPKNESIFIELLEDQEEYIFLIHDSGPGLSEEALSKVFEKYWTGGPGSQNGTGLGLFICKTIVEAHHGRICAENHKSSGATFKFTLPKNASKNKNLSHQPSFKLHQMTKGQVSDKKICIIDDDDDLREVMTWVLMKEGYSIISFNSPREALKFFSEKKQGPDLLILDYHLKEMNGYDFLLRKDAINNMSECPTIIITADSEPLAKKIPARLCARIINKPVDIDSLLLEVNHHLLMTPFGGNHGP